MRFKLAARFLLFAGLCVCLTCEELWLKNAPASNTGRIAFTSYRDGNPEIYVMDADGGNQERLTNHPWSDTEPDWSPDGTKIAFVSRRDTGRRQIHVMDADGKNVIRLTEGQHQDKGLPDWSPDGGKIAFTVEGREWHIAVMDADGNNREKLVDQAAVPSWSPDGRMIAYYVIVDGNFHGTIHLMNANGRHIRRLSHHSRNALDFAPDINPRGLAVSPASKTITTWGKLKKVEFNRP